MITVVCSDKGRHEKVRLTFTGSGSEGDRPGPVQIDFTSKRPDGGKTYRLKCDLCGRDVHLRDDTWTRMVDGIIAAGLSEIDVSHLPC